VKMMVATASESPGNGIGFRFPLARLGKGLTHVRRQVLSFRRELEAAVRVAHGSISIYHASRIHTACVAVRQMARVDKILAAAGQPGAVGTFTKQSPAAGATATQQTGLTHEQWLAYSDRLLKYLADRDRALRDLSLDRDQAEAMWDAIYTPPAAVGGPPASAENSERPESHLAQPGPSCASLDGPAGIPCQEGGQHDQV
jgi:hypothetical protein